MSAKMNILTFDIEEWFHILDNESTRSEKEWQSFEYRLDANMNRIFSFLSDHNQKATFFVLGWVARQFPKIIRQIHDLGFQIGSHSTLHQLAYTQNRDEFKSDLEESIQIIQDVTGSRVDIYRAPGFSVKEENAWVFDVLIDCGIRIDCSIFPAKRAHGGFEEFGHAEPAVVLHKDRQIKELPINLGSFLGQQFVFSGGGYFRLLPYPVIRKLMAESAYVMTYFHPRDFDADQPMIEGLSLLRRFKSYYGLKTALEKLGMLVSDFEFIDLREADKRTDWDSAKRIAV